MGNKLITCSGDTTLALWDLQKTIKINSFMGHFLSAKCVKEISQNGVYVSGGRDGKICLFDARQNMGKGCFSNLKLAATILLYNNTVFTKGILNDVRGKLGTGIRSKKTLLQLLGLKYLNLIMWYL